ncbi:hypothetical protein MMC30_005098 [Trapelia coarctata]|nr:hypothetical protein [Trapelia coarctata]
MSYLHPISPALSKEALNTPPDLTNLKGKTVLLTGGASGLGAAIARRLGEVGTIVTIADIQEELGTAYTAELRNLGYSVHFHPTDVTSYPSLLSAFKAAISHSPDASTLDIVIAAAGLMGHMFMHPSEPAPSLSYDPPEPSFKTIDVNLKGVFYTTMLAKNYLRLPPKRSPGEHAHEHPGAEKPDKSLVLFASTAAYLEVPLLADYCASKMGVRGMFRTMRQPLMSQGIRVNTINPWIMATPLASGVVPLFEANGLAIGKIESVVDAATRCAVDRGIYGRALLVGAAETVDLGDDHEGLDAGPVVKAYVEGEAKGFWETITNVLTQPPPEG